MRLKSSTLSALINFLLGVAWAMALIGALSSIVTNFRIGFLYALIQAFVWALPGLFLVVMLEYVLLGFRRYEEQKKQTRLLEELVERSREKTPPIL